MNFVQPTSKDISWITSAQFPHSAEEAKEEFLSAPEHAQACVEEALNTEPPHPDRSYFIFREEEFDKAPGKERLGIARVQHENRQVKIYIDSFNFDPEVGLYTFVSSEIYDPNASRWAEQPAPDFIDPKNKWLSIEELRDDYGRGREIPKEQVDRVYDLHDEIVLQQDPSCFFNQTDFDSNAEAVLAVLQELEHAPPGTFTILGDEIHPNRYKLCYINRNNEFIKEDLTISANAQYQTKDGSFDNLEDVKTRYNLTSPISTDSGDSESEMGD